MNVSKRAPHRQSQRQPAAARGAAVISLFLLSTAAAGCVPFPHRTPGFTVTGEILDTATITPLADVHVEARLPKTRESAETRTNAQGKFHAYSDGEWRFLYWLIGGGEGKQLIPVEVRVSKAGYESDLIDDTFQVEEDGPREHNLGAVYMQRIR